MPWIWRTKGTIIFLSIRDVKGATRRVGQTTILFHAAMEGHVPEMIAAPVGDALAHHLPVFIVKSATKMHAV